MIASSFRFPYVAINRRFTELLERQESTEQEINEFLGQYQFALSSENCENALKSTKLSQQQKILILADRELRARMLNLRPELEGYSLVNGHELVEDIEKRLAPYLSVLFALISLSAFSFFISAALLNNGLNIHVGFICGGVSAILARLHYSFYVYKSEKIAKETLKKNSSWNQGIFITET